MMHVVEAGFERSVGKTRAMNTYKFKLREREKIFVSGRFWSRAGQRVPLNLWVAEKTRAMNTYKFTLREREKNFVSGRFWSRAGQREPRRPTNTKWSDEFFSVLATLIRWSNSN